MEVVKEIFGKLIDNANTQFIVPLFQRPYSWREEHWEQLWEDLLELYDVQEQIPEHYIGAVVTQQIPSLPGEGSKYLLIDGQQRMTTLMTLLSVIRYKANLEPDRWGRLAEKIQNTWLINQFPKTDEGLVKLRPTRADLEVFHCMVVADGDLTDKYTIPGKDTLIGEAWHYFDKKLSEKLDVGDLGESVINLDRITNIVTDCLITISVTLENDDNPNRIFESLNNTGQPLSESDLIRNYIFMNIQGGSQQEDAYDKLWFPMQEMLGDDIDDFFYRYLPTRNGIQQRKGDTFDVIKKLIADDNVRKELRELHRLASRYAEITEKDTSRLDDSISESIRCLNQLRYEPTRPFLMKILDDFHLGKIEKEELLEVMSIIESFAIRRAVCGIPTHSLGIYFSRMSVGVNFGDTVNSTKGFLENPTWRWPSDEDFLDGFIRYNVYSTSNVSRSGRARLILERLELSFGNKERLDLKADPITIEHIMPQTLSDEWKESLGSGATEIHERWLHTVGNLTLTGYNSELSNSPFSKKKAELKKSNFSLSSSIVECDEWNEETIERRGRELAERALKIWPR